MNFFAAQKFSEAEKILPVIEHQQKHYLCQVFVIIQLISMMKLFLLENYLKNIHQ